MKKFILYIMFIWLSVSGFITSAENINLTQEMEFTEYYGYISLLVNVHTEIGIWEADDKSIFFSIWLLNEMKTYSDLDIIEYLWYVFDLQESLDSLLFNIDDIINQASIVMTEIENILFSLEQKKIECEWLKEISDKNFYLALKDLDSKNMEINLNKSIENQECVSDSRIYYNVYIKILENLDFYFEILKNKYNYIYSNKFNIIENYPNIFYNLKFN
jgi:hypothetical protein